ncbi:MAG: DUF86 domain-containing protein [Vicinamibacteria bacterium]|nr:DUF86 domain-containing protein [Vicinamibacteria bacterium]
MSTWTLAALRQRRDEILRIAARWGARHVRVFGSVARGEVQSTSDVDLLVDFEPGRSLLDHGGRRYTDGGRERFDADELVRVWCVRHLEVIGESVAGLSNELRGAFPEAPWRQVIGMRNVLIHAYFDVDWDEVWNVVARDLAALDTQVRSILESRGAAR